MNPRLGWSLGALALVAGYLGWGWPGVILALTVIVFWLLLQWGRAMRVLRAAGERPVGYVSSAVMLQARLTAGMTMIQVLPLTRSLGQQVSEAPECWAWQDAAGHRVETEWDQGRLTRWQLTRASEATDGTPPAGEPGESPVHPA